MFILYTKLTVCTITTSPTFPSKSGKLLASWSVTEVNNHTAIETKLEIFQAKCDYLFALLNKKLCNST